MKQFKVSRQLLMWSMFVYQFQKRIATSTDVETTGLCALSLFMVASKSLSSCSISHSTVLITDKLTIEFARTRQLVAKVSPAIRTNWPLHLVRAIVYIENFLFKVEFSNITTLNSLLGLVRYRNKSAMNWSISRGLDIPLVSYWHFRSFLNENHPRVK